MDKAGFWALIEESRREFDPNRFNGNQRIQYERIEKALLSLSREELEDFGNFYTEFYFQPYSWAHLAVSYLVEGMMSTDGFDYHRAWLISMGQEVFEDVVKCADHLGKYARLPGVEVTDFCDFDGIQYWIYQERFGGCPASWEISKRPDKLAGAKIDLDDFSYLKAHFPQTWKFRDPDFPEV